MKMKKPVVFLTMIIIQVIVFGQTIINNAENFVPGTILKYQSCYTTGISEGNSGANQTWDFSALKAKPNGLTTVVVDSAKATFYGKYFPDANLVKMYSDGRFVFINKTRDANYLVGYVDTVYDTKTNYPDQQLLIKRPLKYKTTVVDTFFKKMTLQAFKKKVKMNYYYAYFHGIVNVFADGYGRLLLPTGTFDNVIRLKIVQQTGDSVMHASSLINDVTSFVWYDTRHAGFIMRIDSSQSGSQAMVSAQYLLSETIPEKKKK
jgi:hypothetical protein